ncbi:MAG: deoxyuridine 5'-triphosphate nucleotidohydrolase [Candidatus Yonathbacteria bacterium RIFCSPLOWO2_01_FULL_47_33b]|uniref:dUTP diphosphatase n=1 Tax=Candidatus Yonathbacteria bacterium RIFCSPLOWO2_01_FULL_47_33b TaxID=1802727 RepID=A0A1G2SER6_9BACT|nr:MAG: deoxyuridine 5'-triphosphate nucleotidohydrolase [Candidatus Yonathbacteria bacterium RIFCSPLOWO2_01_FULL_47_33b]
MELKIKKLHTDAKVPSYAHPGDAGFDLYAIEEVAIPVGVRVLIGTGIAMDIPDGFVGLIWDKSGLSTTHGLKTLGGVVDAGYRGEVKVGMVNLGTEEYTISAGHKIAQMLIQKVERAEIIEVAELSETVRGEGGFGSTGKE